MVPPARTFGSAQPAGLCTAGPAGRGGQRAGRGQTPGGQRGTGVPARILRYFEEQDLLHPERSGNGYRTYSESAVYRVQQIRGLLDSGLTTVIIRTILPYLNSPDEIHFQPDCLTPQTAGLLLREADRIQQRIDCLARNRDVIRAYLAAGQPGTAASPDPPTEVHPADT
jgi:DNA-binding transcriptional MerR regulator